MAREPEVGTGGRLACLDPEFSRLKRFRIRLTIPRLMAVALGIGLMVHLGFIASRI